MFAQELPIPVREILHKHKVLELFDNQFRGHMREMQTSMFMHVSSVEDIEREAALRREEEQEEKDKKQQAALDKNNRREYEHFEYDKITYLGENRTSLNFSYLQSIILIASYIAGSNKEQTDVKLFDVDRTKLRSRNLNANTAASNKQGTNLVGKTKRFSIDRLIAIVDYLSSLEIEGASECQSINHSSEFYSCINTLVKEDLLKKQAMRTGGAIAE